MNIDNSSTSAPLIAELTYGHNQPLGKFKKEFHIGKLYSFRGPNGCGKTTLLETLSGKRDPIHGQALFNNEDVRHLSQVSHITEISEPVFYPDMSVGEHFKLLSQHSGVDYDKIIAEWECEDFLNLPPSWLSSGQRQRLILAAHLAFPYRVYLADEPERHLDEYWVNFLIQKFREVTQADSIVICASHSPKIIAASDEVIELCDC
ncbi:ABC transporter ATP-binding protein [Corynebacterium poyangense]|uniref:ABC transporter ATP-binding protein n=1 Tax=Corynebacterium poyangense TaxID=2684405 RepID=UPI00165D1E07|nr:ATP-binding cassette domain-containing protein [Corynebacterium poyangense]